MGYSLQPALTALGLVCHVVRPRDWYGGRVKRPGQPFGLISSGKKRRRPRL